MSKALAACAIVLCFQTLARAEEPEPHDAGTTPYIVFAVGNVVDTVGTIYGKSHGNVELDPALKGSAGRIIAVKAISSLAFAAVMKLFEERGHHTVAKILGYAGGGVTFGAGINNIRIAR